MIWCVEDDASIRDIELYALTSTGFEARGFDDGASFWEALQTETPELVLLDVMLPGEDGVSLLKKMKAAPALRDIPIIMATAKGAEYDKIQSLDLGADDYLVKPFKVERVMQTLERARNLLRSPETAPEPARPPLSRPRVEGRMMLHHRGGVSFLSFEDIVLIQREERSTVLYTADGSRYVTGDSLGDMEERLPPDLFFRCHKSYIVNLNKIRDITPYGRWTYAARLEGIPQDALITREKYDELERMFQQE